MALAGNDRAIGWKNAFLVTFFALQLAATVPGFVQNKHDTRGNFSWNMYSVDHQCRARYALYAPDGTITEYDYEDVFNRPSRAQLVFHRDTLPAFHEYLCRLVRESGEAGELHAQVECRNYGEEPVVLVDRSVSICTAPNWGVQ